MTTGHIPGHTGKMIYISERDARSAMKNGLAPKNNFKVYVCRHEYIHYHVTSWSRKKYKQLKKRLESR